MRRTLRRYGLMMLAVVVTTLGLTTPAHAADTGTITGRITLPGGTTPSVGSYVAVYGENYGYSDGYSTDEGGYYTIANLPVDSYRIEIWTDGRPNQWVPNKASSTAASLYAVTAGGTTTVNETLLTHGFIAGKLSAPGGAGVPDVFVYVFSSTGAYSSAMTDAQGSYRAPVLGGQYKVQFQMGAGTQYAPGKRTEAEAGLYTVTAPNTTTVNETLLPRGSASGTVLKANGQPAADVEVEFSAPNGTGFSSTYTDDSGNYRIDGLAPGGYQVSFQVSDSTMYHPHTLNYAAAQLVTITANTVVDVDETLFAMGSIAGRFTNAAGEPLPGVWVDANGQFESSGSTETDQNGNYRIDDLFIGNFKVRFFNPETQREQYATAKLNSDTANQFAVTAGGVTTVDDSALRTGSVEISVKEQGTNNPVSDFLVAVANVEEWSDSDKLLIGDVPVGTHKLFVMANGYEDSAWLQEVTVTEGQKATVTVLLKRQPLITGQIVDRVTNQPLTGMCVFTVQTSSFYLPDGCGDTTDGAGNYKITAPVAGTYNLFVIPWNNTAGYGAQWVGALGGTGDQRQAAVITVGSAAVTTGPTIKMDKAGTITGVVTSETGQPLQDASVAGSTYHPGLGGGYGQFALDSAGRYTTKFFGPYNWPLVFAADNHAIQWSGGTADRFSATTVKVTSGATTTFNYTMKVGRAITGTVRMPDGGAPEWARIMAKHTVSRDFVGISEVVDGKYKILVIAPTTLTADIEGTDPGFFNATWSGGAYRVINRRDVIVHFCVKSATALVMCGTNTRIDQTVPLPADPAPGTTLPRPPAGYVPDRPMKR